jgi:hypothetical protein
MWRFVNPGLIVKNGNNLTAVSPPPFPIMIQHTPLSTYRAPVPSAWQPFMVDNDYRFVATNDSSSSRDYSVTARHTSGEICSVKKFTVGSEVSAPPYQDPLINKFFSLRNPRPVYVNLSECTSFSATVQLDIDRYRMLRHLRAHKTV